MTECYTCEEDFVTIEDPELGISLRGRSTTDDLHGPSRFYSAQGVLLSEAWFFQGRREGKMRQYYPSGALYSIQRFKNGEREGKQEYYDEGGMLRTLMHYCGGQLDGVVELYWPNGNLKRKSLFSKGKRVGEDQFWSSV